VKSVITAQSAHLYDQSREAPGTGHYQLFLRTPKTQFFDAVDVSDRMISYEKYTSCRVKLTGRVDLIFVFLGSKKGSIICD